MILQIMAANEDNLPENELTEAAWEEWQVSYGIRRNKLFAPFLMPLKKLGGKIGTFTVLNGARDCYIELIHRNSDPGMWIIRRSKKVLWFKRQVSSRWFNGEVQAREFADEMMQEYNRER